MYWQITGILKDHSAIRQLLEKFLHPHLKVMNPFLGANFFVLCHRQVL